jgi:hypothetical protein
VCIKDERMQSNAFDEGHGRPEISDEIGLGRKKRYGPRFQQRKGKKKWKFKSESSRGPLGSCLCLLDGGGDLHHEIRRYRSDIVRLFRVSRNALHQLLFVIRFGFESTLHPNIRTFET